MLVIHIGPRKTATTWLQSNFFRNRKELLKKGWLYPVVALRAQNAHHQVVAEKDDVLAGRGSLFRRLKRAADQARRLDANLLLSSESFRTWRPDDFASLGEVLGQDDILIVYTLRDPLSVMVSLWGEMVKTGRTQPLPKYVGRQLKDPLNSQPLNALLELEPILAHPKLRTAVLNFEEIKRMNEDIYTAFGRHILGLEGLKPSRQKPANFSFPVEISDYLRLLAAEMNYRPGESRTLFSRLFQSCHSPADIEKIAMTIREVGGDARVAIRLDRNVAWYDELETRLLAAFGPRLHPLPQDGRIFPRGATEIVAHDGERLASQPEIGTLLAESGRKMKAGRIPWSHTRIMRIWRTIQRTLGF